MMRNSYDCGPSALSQASGTDYDQLIKLWGWKGYNDVRDNLLDSPWHHFAVLEKLRMPWQIVTCGDITSGKATPGKTVVLLHNLSNPILAQHWVVLESVTQDSVRVHWGDGTVKTFSKANFAKAYSAGTPACAYEVGRGRIGLTRYQCLWVKLTGKFI